jgi:hypothetical protein
MEILPAAGSDIWHKFLHWAPGYSTMLANTLSPAWHLQEYLYKVEIGRTFSNYSQHAHRYIIIIFYFSRLFKIKCSTCL